jgi:hypothetical protein
MAASGTQNQTIFVSVSMRAWGIETAEAPTSRASRCACRNDPFDWPETIWSIL